MFTRGVLEAWDLVQHVMVELRAQWLERRGDVVEIPHPAGALVDCAGNADAHAIRMPVHPRARMRLRHAGEPVRSLERELGEELHHRSPSTLCVWMESRHCGLLRQ